MGHPRLVAGRVKRHLPALLLVVAAVGGLQAYGCYQREVGRRDATIKARDAAIDSLRARAARRDTIYLATVDTLWQVRRVTDRRLDTLHLIDTLIHRDTVIQLVERERLACDAVISSCEVRVAIRDTLIDSLRVQLKAERRRDRVFGVKLPSRTVMLGAGVLGGLLLGRK